MRVLRVCVCVCAAIYVSLFLWWAPRGILAPAFGFNLASMRFFFRSVRGKDSLRHGWCIDSDGRGDAASIVGPGRWITVFLSAYLTYN